MPIRDFKAFTLMLASPEDILSWSYGEVKKSETINYRTLRCEPDGLMCERIFGPTADYECYCGKYRKVRYKGIVCDKCGVEVTTSKVRRERMGHIKLAIPIVHVWFGYGAPNVLSVLLDIPTKKLTSVVYYLRYLVLEVDEGKRQESIKKLADLSKKEIEQLQKSYREDIEALEKEHDKAKKAVESGVKKGGTQLLTLQNKVEDVAKRLALKKKTLLDESSRLEEEFKQIEDLVKNVKAKDILSEEEIRSINQYNLSFFEPVMGAEAVKHLLTGLDIDKEIKKIKRAYNLTVGANRLYLERRLKILRGLKKNNIKPEWIILDILPVIPADLRPIVSLPGGRFAISDLNDLYRRVINRNNRLRELIEIGAPSVILRNEKRMLQEAVDALIDNSHRPVGNPVVNRMSMPYKSLADQLRGKEGRFRRNLLGKRVDYSARSVIIPDPKLTLNQCGLPKNLALELYKPFIIHKLIADGYAENIRVAKDMIDEADQVVWRTLKKLIKKRPVLLNRPPTLHKQNIQAFFPVLVSGSAIRVNPLICSGYNADFDGDQMGVFLPISDEALKEFESKLMAKFNILDEATGKPIIAITKDMALGVYYLTGMEDSGVKEKELKYFISPEQVLQAYYTDLISLREPVKVMVGKKVIKSTAGRAILNHVFPKDFEYINEQLNKKEINSLLYKAMLMLELDEVVQLLDNVKRLAFEYATKSGFSISLNDISVPQEREKILTEAKKKEDSFRSDFANGLLTKEERDRLIIDLWRKVEEELTQLSWDSLSDNNPIRVQVSSGANGDETQARQITAMKGVVRDPAGRWVVTPIKGNYVDGLNSYEFFIGARGARKGQADTALRTADSGYLARKLVDVAQDVIIRMEDCGFDGEGILLSEEDGRAMNLYERLTGRVAAQTIKHPNSKKVLVRKNQEITPEKAAELEKAKVTEAYVRSPLTCQAPLGICSQCYGHDVGKNKMVESGKAVGIIAAQSISEPTTQMTLNTFHKGGVGADITSGFPRVGELFEARVPKYNALLAPIDGKVTVKKQTVKIKGSKPVRRFYLITPTVETLVKDKAKVKKGDALLKLTEESIIKAPFDGTISIEGNVLFINGKKTDEEVVSVPITHKVSVSTGDTVERGDFLTEGFADPKVLADYKGTLQAQLYIIDEIFKVYQAYGSTILDKHLEIIVRQMAKLAKIIDPGDSKYVEGTFVSKYIVDLYNSILKKKGKKEIIYVTGLAGVSLVALNSDSVLSSMSFERLVSVLTEASILAKTDHLRGLKENVIIGRLIPTDENAIIQDVTKLEEVA